MTLLLQFLSIAWWARYFLFPRNVPECSAETGLTSTVDAVSPVISGVRQTWGKYQSDFDTVHFEMLKGSDF